MPTAAVHPPKAAAQLLLPREHGATAMLLTPFFAAAILLRQVYWPELAALVAVWCAFAIKDPLVVIARQRFLWKQKHPETRAAKVAVLIEAQLLAVCGVTLMLVRNWRPFVPLFVAAGAFTLLAVTLNVRNKQRSAWFQVASAVALSATSLIACLSAIGSIPEWCWLLWILCALQAAAGIFVVHARLDARIAARKGHAPESHSVRAAFLCLVLLIFTAVLFAWRGRYSIAAALFLTAGCYLAELRRQKNPESLQMPLTQVGLQSLTVSIVYVSILIVGLWRS